MTLDCKEETRKLRKVINSLQYQAYHQDKEIAELLKEKKSKELLSVNNDLLRENDDFIMRFKEEYDELKRIVKQVVELT